SGGEAQTELAPADGVFPEGFYATTNLETSIRKGGRWLPVAQIEMDCGVVLERSGEEWTARCTPMHHIRQGDLVVIGDEGVRVQPMDRPDQGDAFAFMDSSVSTERPKELVVAAIAKAMQDAHASGEKILFVGGPAILHTGANRSLEAIINAGWIDVLF